MTIRKERILVTGSREWRFIDGIADNLPLLDLDVEVTVLHGGCRGADTLAGICATGIGHFVEAYPVDHALDGPWPAAGPRRNARMIQWGRPDRCIAFGALWQWDVPQDDDMTTRGRWKTTGTHSCASLALRAGIPVRWVAEPGAEAVELTEMPKRPGGEKR